MPQFVTSLYNSVRSFLSITSEVPIQTPSSGLYSSVRSFLSSTYPPPIPTLSPTAVVTVGVGAPTAANKLADTLANFIGSYSIVGNSILLADCICTTGKSTVKFACTWNPVAKCLYGVSICCGVVGTLGSGISVLGLATGISIPGVAGCFTARSFKELGRYTYAAGNITSGNVSLSNATDIVKGIKG